MKRLWIALLLILTLLQAEGNVSNEAEANRTSATQQKTQTNTPANPDRLKNLEMQLRALSAQGIGGNVWTKIYSSYKTYQTLKKRQEELIRDIFQLQRKGTLTPEEQQRLEKAIEERQTNVGKLQLLSEFQRDPFKKLLEPPEIGEPPVIGNPFGIISALSYLKKLQSDQQLYDENFKSLESTIALLTQERKILLEMLKYRPRDPELIRRLEAVNEELDTLRPPYEILKTSREVYNKKIEELHLKVNSEIRREAQKAITIGGIILFLFILFLLFKRLIRRYMGEKESFYTVNKISNLLFVTVVLLILLFAYIENVNYLVTILGFASAGIAIAMKDWFMSMMGWFVIVLGGSIHVGDRIKVVRNGIEYVGDVVDISLLRMTIQEDITLTTYMHNRRAGRIIFVPNNYIFTDMIANYSHAGLKTVWDGIDFTITFDSDGAKAASIAKEIAKKYSKGYTDITRKQLNKLRSSYHLKNTNVEPRVFTFMEEYGIRVSVWYLTNAFATLTLRSTISSEILQRIREEKEIALAYPTQAIYMERPIPHVVRGEGETGKAPAAGLSREEPL